MTDTNTNSEPFGKAFSAEIADSFLFQIHRIKKALFRRTNALMNEAGITLQLEQLPLIMILQRQIVYFKKYNGFREKEFARGEKG